jgi:hypothetical protein
LQEDFQDFKISSQPAPGGSGLQGKSPKKSALKVGKGKSPLKKSVTITVSSDDDTDDEMEVAMDNPEVSCRKSMKSICY